MKTKGFFLIAIFSFALSLNLFAQQHEIGLAAGGLNYTGELSPNLDVRFYRQSIYGFYKYNFNPTWGLKLSLLEGEFYAQDAISEDPLPIFRNRESGSMIFEFAAIGEYNFFNYRKNGDRRRFSPYLSGGLAFFTFSQDAIQRKEVSDGTSLAIPFGIGVKYQLSKQVNLGFEFIARKTFTDHLDGISNRQARNGLELGDPHGKDWYYFTGLMLSYTFYGVKCPDHFR